VGILIFGSKVTATWAYLLNSDTNITSYVGILIYDSNITAVKEICGGGK